MGVIHYPSSRVALIGNRIVDMKKPILKSGRKTTVEMKFFRKHDFEMNGEIRVFSFFLIMKLQ